MAEMNLPLIKRASEVETLIEDLLLALSQGDLAKELDPLDFKKIGAALIYWGQLGGNRFVHQLRVPGPNRTAKKYPVKIESRDLASAEKVEAEIRKQLPDVLPPVVHLWTPNPEVYSIDRWEISGPEDSGFEATLTCDHFGYDWQDWDACMRELETHLRMMDWMAPENPKLKNRHKLKWHKRYVAAISQSVQNVRAFIEKAMHNKQWQDLYHLGVVFNDLGEGKGFRHLSHEEHADFELHDRHRVKESSTAISLKKKAAPLPMPEIPEEYFEESNLKEDAWVITIPGYESKHFDNLESAYAHANTQRDIGNTVEIRWLRGTNDIPEEERLAKKLAKEHLKTLPEGYQGRLEIKLGPAIGIAWRSEQDSEFKITEVWHNVRWALLFVEEGGRISLIRAGPGKMPGGDE